MFEKDDGQYYLLVGSILLAGESSNCGYVQVDDKLAWSSSIGDEDGAEGTVGWFTAEKNKAIKHHYFRSEHQTLRRLPRSAEEKANKASFDGSMEGAQIALGLKD
ncbi:hypothetical protein IFR05_011671, partial [Cadophora sp. M221]